MCVIEDATGEAQATLQATQDGTAVIDDEK